jgi:gliding motility-associated-like protein
MKLHFLFLLIFCSAYCCHDLHAKDLRISTQLQDTINSSQLAEEGVFVPNVFSPNGDNINDWFYIRYRDIREFNLEIYNRWGVKVWETNLPEVRWDGRTFAGVMVPEATYFYRLKAVGLSGKDYSTSGTVTLFR